MKEMKKAKKRKEEGRKEGNKEERKENGDKSKVNIKNFFPKMKSYTTKK